MGTLARAAFFVAALPAILRAAARAGWLERRLPLDELVARLRTTPAFRWRGMASPAWLLATLDRLLPLLPPWRHGPCLKRSLLLLDLWSRCGLRPRLHLSVRWEGGRRSDDLAGREGHAWVTVEPTTAEAATGLLPPVEEPLPATSSHGYPDAFVL